MKYSCLSRIPFEDLKKNSKATCLFSNGVIRLNRGSSFIPVNNYSRKSDIMVRLVIYAVVDILNEDSKPFKSLVSRKVTENFDEYMNRVAFRVLFDKDFIANGNSSIDIIMDKIANMKDRIYKSDYISAFNKLVTTLFFLTISNSSENCTHYIGLTKFGKEVKDLIDAGYVL